MARKRLTDKQRTVLDFIKSSIACNGYAPTLREIGRAIGIRSTNGVNDHLRALERKGYLERDRLKARALRPVDTPSATMAEIPQPEIPLLGWREVPALPRDLERELRIECAVLGRTVSSVITEAVLMWIDTQEYVPRKLRSAAARHAQIHNSSSSSGPSP